MSNKHTQGGWQFLTVQEAAEKLGKSRLRVREAVARGILPARRDNEGRLRVDLPNRPHLPDAKASAKTRPDLAPDAVLGFLFDEVEELEDALADRDAQLRALSDLLARQSAALENAGAELDASQARQARMSGLLDRTFARLETAGDDLEKSLSQTARFEALLARAIDLAEVGRTDGDTAAFGQTADRAIALLDAALASAEAGHHATERTGEMLERALAAAERSRRDLEASNDRVAQQQETIETVLDMSERAVALVPRDAAPKRGFFRWLFGV
jgi:hypothetical protein